MKLAEKFVQYVSFVRNLYLSLTLFLSEVMRKGQIAYTNLPIWLNPVEYNIIYKELKELWFI